MKIENISLFLIGCLFLLQLSGCAHIKLEDSAAAVNVYYSLSEKSNCDHVGDVIGSDGNLFTYLFMSNTGLTRGALNDIRNEARAMGGDTVFILRELLPYTTTTTFVGSVYTCNKASPTRN